MADKIKILFISNCFPNSYEPHGGIWLKQIADGLSKYCDLKIISPVPWFPLQHSIFGRWSKIAKIKKHDIFDKLDVFYPRWIAIPKMTCLHGIFFFLGLVWHLFTNKKKYSHIEIINTFWIYPDGFASLLLARLLKLPIILGALGTDVNEDNTFILKKKYYLGLCVMPI